MFECSYSTIAWTAALAKGRDGNVDYGFRGKNTRDNVFNFFNALGDIAFAFAGHNVVLEIQATIPSPSKKPMWKGVVFAYVVVALCYFPVAFIGYYMFGNSVEDNILVALEKPRWLIACANVFVFVHVVGGYQVSSFLVFLISSSMFCVDVCFVETMVGICDAGFRHVGDVFGEGDEDEAFFLASFLYSYHICW